MTLAAQRIGDALHAAGPMLANALESLAGFRAAAEADLSRLLPLDRLEGPLRAALGVGAMPLSLPVYLVTMAPHSLDLASSWRTAGSLPRTSTAEGSREPCSPMAS
ncbi:hypothetical protein ACFQ0B_79865 [Nonomuraea thailandensis]